MLAAVTASLYNSFYFINKPFLPYFLLSFCISFQINEKISSQPSFLNTKHTQHCGIEQSPRFPATCTASPSLSPSHSYPSYPSINLNLWACFDNERKRDVMILKTFVYFQLLKLDRQGLSENHYSSLGIVILKSWVSGYLNVSYNYFLWLMHISTACPGGTPPGHPGTLKKHDSNTLIPPPSPGNV